MAERKISLTDRYEYWIKLYFWMLLIGGLALYFMGLDIIGWITGCLIGVVIWPLIYHALKIGEPRE